MRAFGLAIAVLLITAAPAAADNIYNVAAPATDAAGTCAPQGSNAFTCTTLRTKVNATNASPGNDVITLGPGSYPLTQGALALTQDTGIIGSGARFTTIQPTGTRAFTVGSGVNAQLAQLTLQGGTAGSGNGGNVLNSGHLSLVFVRVTGGTASSGGGVATDASNGTLTIQQSLIDHNSATNGGGVANLGQTSSSSLLILASTIALNTNGGGIYTGVNGSDSVTVFQSTIARNAGTGLTIAQGGADLTGTIVANNTTNCGTTKPANQGGNLENAASCGFGAAGSNKDPQLSANLVDAGGQTDVLTIPDTSPAIGIVQPCTYPVDQAGRQRVLDVNSACDAGAYEQAVAVAPPPPPEPTPIPTPVPTPTPTPTATPVAGKSVAGTVVEGKVLVRRPGGKFVALDPTKPIPNGSTIDAKRGTIELTAQQKPGGAVQKAKFFDGIFKVTQTKKTTDLTLNETLAKCPKRHSAHAAAKKKKPRTRKLWGSGSGSFRTRGQYSAATVRGTEWLVQDSCAGTLTRVKKGAVTVRDNVKHKTIVLRAGKRYLAKPRR
jgi:hypothetical protein